MTQRVSDEMLMAYVDGELVPETAEAVRREVDADPALARRVRGFRESRRLARAAYEDVLADPPPDRLAASLDERNGGRATRSPTRALAARVALPLAASIAVVAGLGGYLAGRTPAPAPGGLLGPTALADAVGETRGGESREIRIAGETVRLTVLAAYEVDGGLCRTFDARTDAVGGVRGVGCGYGGRWSVDVAVAVPAADAISSASAGAAAVVDAFLDSVGALGPLDPEEEDRSR